MKLGGKSMKQMKRYLVLVLIFAMGISILPMNASAAKKPRLSKTKVTMQVGKTVQLKVKNNKKKVKWSSSNKKVAAVSKKGKVKAINSGNAKITAKISKKKLVCRVKVKRTVTDKDNNTNGDTSQSNDVKINQNVTSTEQPTITVPTATPAVAPTAASTAPPTTTPTVTPTITPTVAPTVTPTVAPVIQPTTTPLSTPTLDSIAANYRTLKTYIQKNGKTQQSGENKFIVNYIDEFMYTIEYNNEDEAFVFSTYSEIDLSNGGDCRNLLTVEIKESDLRNGDLEFVTLFSSGACAMLTLTDSLEKLDFNSPLDWKVVDYIGLDEDSWKEQADVYGGLSYLGWNLLLEKTVKMNLSDLGFGIAI